MNAWFPAFTSGFVPPFVPPFCHRYRPAGLSVAAPQGARPAPGVAPGGHRAGGFNVWFCADTCTKGPHMVATSRQARHAPSCKRVPPPPVTCARKNLRNRSVSKTVVQTFSPPPTPCTPVHEAWTGKKRKPKPAATKKRGTGRFPGGLPGVFAWSALGYQSKKVGTVRTAPEKRPNPLSRLRKSVPTLTGNRSPASGNSGNRSFQHRAGRSGPWRWVWCLVHPC